MKPVMLIFALLLIVGEAFCQNLASITQEAARKDLTLLYNSLVARHPGVYRHVTAAELKSSFDEALAAADRTLSFWEFYRVASRLTASIKCGHTRLSLPENARNNFTTKGKFFPLPVLFADATMYARWPDQSVKRVTAINGKKVEAVMQSIFANFTEDGNSVKAKYDVAEQAFGLLYARHVELSPATFNIEFISVKGTAQGQAIAPVDWSGLQNLSFYEPEDVKPISFRMIGDSGYLDIDTFHEPAYSSAGIDYNDFLGTTFAALKKNKVQKLIVDIRGNGGGNDQYGANICSYMTSKSFAYFRTVKQKSGSVFSPVSHPCLDRQPAAANAFTGKICLLIDGVTFSTAADVASIVSANHFARVIGRETGGGYDGNTSGRSESVLLANSGISVTIPLWYYENEVPLAKELHRGVIPDELINRTPESIAQHKDLEIERALKWLGGQN